jgi:hypothetical protein
MTKWQNAEISHDDRVLDIGETLTALCLAQSC